MATAINALDLNNRKVLAKSIGKTIVADTDTYNILNDAIQALPADGGTIEFLGSALSLTGTIVVDRPVRFRGFSKGALRPNWGGAGLVRKPGTLILSLTDGIPLFDVQSEGVTFEHMHMQSAVNTNPSAAHVAILGTQFTHCLVHNCFIEGFARAINVVQGHYWQLLNNDFYNNTYASVVIANTGNTDEGDARILHNNFTGGDTLQYDGATAGRSTATAHLIYNSGGGLLFAHNKTNAGKLATIQGGGRHSYPPNSIIINVFGSSDYFILDNSIEGNSSHNIIIDLANASTSNMKINGNQFLGLQNTASGVYGVKIQNGGSSNFIIRFEMCNNNAPGDGALSLAHINNVLGGIISHNIGSSPARGTPFIKLGTSNLANLVVNDSILTARNGYDNGSGLGAVPHPYIVYENFDNGQSVAAVVKDVRTKRIYNAGRSGSYAITAISVAGTSATLTIGTNVFAVNDTIWVAGATGFSHNNRNLRITAKAGNDITVYNPAGFTSSWTTGGYVTNQGQQWEVLLFRNKPINLVLEVEAKLGASADKAYAARFERNVLVSSNAMFISGVASDNAVGGNNGVGGVYITAGSSTNASVTNQAINAGAATALISNPVVSELAAGAGSAFEVLFEMTTPQTALAGTWNSSGVICSQINTSVGNASGAFRDVRLGDTVYNGAQYRTVIDIVDEHTFVTDTAFSAGLSAAVVSVDYTGLTKLAGKMRILIRPVNDSKNFEGSARLGIQGNFFRLIEWP